MERRFGFVVLLAVIACLTEVQCAPSIGTEQICTSGKLDLVLVVNVAGSDQHRFEANRDAALEIARAMPIGWDKVVIAVIQYSKVAIMKLQFGSSETLEVVNETIWGLDWTGGVALGAEAMDLAMIQFRRSRNGADRVIIVFSDGNSLNSWTEVQNTAERLKYSHAKIFAVSLGGNTYEPELKAYIGQSNGTIIQSRSELDMLKKELLKYTVSACHNAEGPSFASKIEARHGEEADEESSKQVKSSERSSSNERSKSAEHGDHHATSAEHKVSTTHGKMTNHKHNTTRHDRISTSKRTTTFVAFPKKTTVSTKATPRTTRKPTTRSSTLRTTHHSTTSPPSDRETEAGTSAGNSTAGNKTADHGHVHTNKHITVTSNPSTTSRVPSTPDLEPTTPKVAPAPAKPTTTTPDVFDPIARQQAIEKMIDRAAHHA